METTCQNGRLSGLATPPGGQEVAIGRAELLLIVKTVARELPMKPMSSD